MAPISLNFETSYSFVEIQGQHELPRASLGEKPLPMRCHPSRVAGRGQSGFG
jgi:hypothetical protein